MVITTNIRVFLKELARLTEQEKGVTLDPSLLQALKRTEELERKMYGQNPIKDELGQEMIKRKVLLSESSESKEINIVSKYNEEKGIEIQ